MKGANPRDEFAPTLGEDQLLLSSWLLESLMEGIMVTDTSGVIKYINLAFSEITGYGKEALGKTPRILKSGKHDLIFYQQLWSKLEQEGQWKGELWNRRKNGDIYVQATTITVIKDENARAIYYTAVFSDITEKKLEEKQLMNDLLLAQEVQKGLLSQPIRDRHIHIEGLHAPSIQVGGDMYAWYQIDEHRYGIYLMDVMGHGIASSLVGISIHSLLRGMIKKVVHPAKVMKELNLHVNALFKNNPSAPLMEYYITALYVVVDVKNRILQYTSAGHPPGFLVDESGRAIELNIGTVPLGMLPEIEVETGELVLNGRSSLVLYTDGLFENEQKGTRENIESLKKQIIEHRNCDAPQLLSSLLTSFSKTEPSKEFLDDITIVAATIFS